MKKIGIIGSTGSIGQSALQVVRDQKDFFKVTVLAAGQNDQLLGEQAHEFQPELIALWDSERGQALAKRLSGTKIRVVWGEEGLSVAAAWENMDQALFAMVGMQGLKPLCEAIVAGKDVAIATKEPLVSAGSYLQELAQKYRVQILPVDSEHSAIWQCLEGQRAEDLKRVSLTASGGPFLGYSLDEMEKVSVAEALNHPRWKMGKKISIDSATLMNKGLEVIEAANLFHLKAEQINILIHPEAIVHSVLEFLDGSCLAQLSIPDMRLPIQYALSYPRRLKNPYPGLDLTQMSHLTFHKPDFKKFPALDIAYEVVEKGGTYPAVLNAANEVAVKLFLEEKIKFTQITALIDQVIDRHNSVAQPDLDDILDADAWARRELEEKVYVRVR